ncbi:hypothetical protein [Franconibacter pulveris]|uniref:hypothetical protein n=1 Tax=Franconibacter pulveris TaxID=435910 RepID=UPI000F66DBAC|nr:hypothetical protein [Franconibacter pulveris]
MGMMLFGLTVKDGMKGFLHERESVSHISIPRWLLTESSPRTWRCFLSRLEYKPAAPNLTAPKASGSALKVKLIGVKGSPTPKWSISASADVQEF